MEYLCSASENCMTLYVVCVLPVADPHQIMQPVRIIVCIAVAIAVLILACCLCAVIAGLCGCATLEKMKSIYFCMRRQDGLSPVVRKFGTGSHAGT